MPKPDKVRCDCPSTPGNGIRTRPSFQNPFGWPSRVVAFIAASPAHRGMPRLASALRQAIENGRCANAGAASRRRQ
jgi:hypothetical protein